MEVSKIQQKLQWKFASKGMDIVQPFLVDWYNSQVEPKHHLPTWQSSTSVGFLLGNTKSIWKHFIEEIEQNRTYLEKKNPFDDFIENTIEYLLKDLEMEYKIRYAHLPTPYHIAFQKLAHISGLAYLNKMYLCIHPKYGPWFSLRAAIVLPISMEIFKPQIKNPCIDFDCQNACGLKFAKTLEKESHCWQDWLKIRDACPLGREYRFDEEQIIYHYTKNKDILKKLLYK